MADAPRQHRTQKQRQAITADSKRASRSRRGYDMEWYEVIRPAILLRDGYQCSACGLITANEANLHVDHIRPFRGLDDPLRTDFSNLQVLCRSCHSAKTVRHDGGFGRTGRETG